MSGRAHVRHALWLVIALGAACIDRTLPPDVILTCDPADASTCPTGTACQPGLLVCVEEGKLDSTAPTPTLTFDPAVARLGTDLIARLEIDEPIEERPQLAFSFDGPEGSIARAFSVDEVASGAGGQDWVLSYTPQGDEPEGSDIEVAATVVDRVGLDGETSGLVRFDFTAPAPPPVDSSLLPAGQIATVWLKAPGGMDAIAVPVSEVRVPVGGMDPADRVVLRTTPDGDPLTDAPVNNDGSARAPLVDDYDTMWVSARDPVGNESEVVRVAEQLFVGTTNPIEQALPAAQLHLLALDTAGPLTAGRERVRFQGNELRGPMTVARIDLEAPGGRYGAAMVYDPARSELLMIGGTDGLTGETTGDAWSWNGESWVPRFLGAPPRVNHTLGVDPTSGDVVMVGGEFGFNSSPRSEVWTKGDGLFVLTEEDVGFSDGVSSLLRINCQSPSVAFDPTRPGVLMVHACPFRGSDPYPYGQAERVDGEWRFIEVPPDPQGDGNPLALRRPCMIADSVNDRVVLFGGMLEDQADGVYFGDTWTWDGASWTLAVAADPAGINAPQPRTAPFCAFDGVAGRVLVGGGYRRIDDATIAYPQDLWAFSATGWERLADWPGDPRPTPQAAFDPLRGELVMFGGAGGPADTSTLVFDGVAWRTLLGSVQTPPGGQGASLVPFDDRLVLFGVSEASDPAVLWELTDAWRAGPGVDVDFLYPRVDGQLARRGNELLIVGGGSGTNPDVISIVEGQSPQVVAALPGATESWTDLSVAAHPSGVIAAVGGYRFIDPTGAQQELGVWFLDGATWTAGPTLYGPYDEPGSATLLWEPILGAWIVYTRCTWVDPGTDCSVHTLAFNSVSDHAAAWQTYDTSVGSDALQVRGGAAFVFDEALGAPVLVGGDGFEADDGFTDEAHVWRTDHWVRTPIVDAESDGALPRLLGAAAAFDPGRGRTVLFSGSPGFSQPFARTYTLDALAFATPAVVATFDPSLADVPGKSAAIGVTLRIAAGATAAGSDGYRVRVWDQARWVDVGGGSAGPGTEQPVVLPEVTVVVAADIVAGALLRGTLPVQLAPLAPNGADRARFRVQRIQAELLLRTPESD